MDLHYLELFNTIAKYESYKKASELLHISQPALSVQIKKLESQIGLKLFDKTGNRIHLNENGIMLQQYTRKIFDIVDELQNHISDMQNTVGGTLNIGGSNSPGSYILPEVIGAFKKLYPGIRFNLHISDTSEISELIHNGTLDIAVNGGNCQYNSYISVEKLFDDKLVIVASPQNPYFSKESLTSVELKHQSFVMHKVDSQLYQCYKRLIGELNIPENISMYLGNIDAIKKAVSSDLGISLLPYVAVKFELMNGLLKVLDIPEFKTDYPYQLIYNKNKTLSPASRKFINFIKSSYNS